MLRAAAACRAKHRLQPCEPKPRPAEARRHSPPLASAREQHSADRSRACELKQRALFLNKANAACGGEPGDSRSGELPRREAAARATLRITKPQNEKNRRKKNARQNKQFLIPTAPLRRQRTAESTDHAGTSRSLHHSGSGNRRLNSMKASDRNTLPHSGPTIREATHDSETRAVSPLQPDSSSRMLSQKRKKQKLPKQEPKQKSETQEHPTAPHNANVGPAYFSSVTLARSSLPPNGGASLETVQERCRICGKAA